jgi:membrane protease YdiL (CAAX protease family)
MDAAGTIAFFPSGSSQLPNEFDTSAGLSPETPESLQALRASRNKDKKRLWIWILFVFFLPAAILYAFRVPLKLDTPVISVGIQLPIKLFMALTVVLATWIVSRVEKRPLNDYGIPPSQALGLRFWEGGLWGFAMMSAILFVLHISGHFQIDSAALHGGAIARYAVAWGAVFYAVGISEEFAFRGYLLFSIARRRRFWWAALIVSAIFAAVHVPNPGENAFGILQVFVVGMLFCLMIQRTGNLWFAVGFHAAWDWAETFFYGTPDSGLLGVGRLLNTSAPGPNWLTGGSAGPEGSVLALAVLLLCALLVHWRFPKAIYPDQPV